MKKYIIELSHVSKQYKIRHKKSFFKGFLGNREYTRDFWALRNINLKIKKGERVGIVGPNGSGKTTLLRMISGISIPTSGTVDVSGKIGTLMNLGAGFHPHLTGSENLYLNSIYFGISRKELENKYDEIIEYSGLKDFIDAPFYTYSSGMKFRLAFSVAVVSEYDILLIDEVISSGDLDFQNKAIKTIVDAQNKRGLTTLISSHIPRLVISLADTFYTMDNGMIFPVGLDKIKELVKLGEAKYRLKNL